MGKIAVLILILISIAMILATGCTSSSTVIAPSGNALNGTYTNGAQVPIVTFEPDGVIGYIGVNGIDDNQFYGGHYSFDGNTIDVTLTDKQVGSGAFQKLDQPIQLQLAYIDDNHIGTPDGGQIMPESFGI